MVMHMVSSAEFLEKDMYVPDQNWNLTKGNKLYKYITEIDLELP